MPRPQGGYKNAAGEPIPGTHDPIQRFMDQTALKIWAHKRGQQGLPLWDRTAIDIGSCVHAMADLDLRGRPDREIEAYAHQCLVAPDHLRKAFASFASFRAWRQQCQVRAIAQETPLVSEAHQYGGTPDTIAMIGGGIGLIEFKTSPKPYPDHLIAMAAHGQLWQETHPQHPLTGGYHLLLLPKDGAPFRHLAYSDLSAQWKLFTLYLEAYRLDKATGTPLSLAEAAPVTTPAAAPAQPKPSRAAAPRARKPKVETPPLHVSVKFAPALQQAAEKARIQDQRPLGQSRPMTMGEILRAYGHVREAVAS